MTLWMLQRAHRAPRGSFRETLCACLWIILSTRGHRSTETLNHIIDEYQERTP